MPDDRGWRRAVRGAIRHDPGPTLNAGQLSLPFLGNAVSARARGAGAARTCMRLPWLPWTLRISTGSSPGWAEPVRHAGVELCDLAWPHRDVVLAEDQAHLTREHVEPLVALVGAEVALALGRDDDLPDGEPARLLGEREDEPAVAGARLEPDRAGRRPRARRPARRAEPDRPRRAGAAARGLASAARSRGARACSSRCRSVRRRSVKVMPRRVRRRFRRGPTWARTSGIADVGSTRSTLTQRSRKQQRKWRPSTPSGSVSVMENERYDVVVVGGGAAGLSAALVLGRARRRVAVVDGGAPRNAPAAHMHGYLSRDGMPPADLLAAGRDEAAAYGVEFIAGQVVSIEPGFSVTLAEGGHARGETAADRDRSDRRAAADPRTSGALGQRLPPLPLLPRLGSSRSAARGARHQRRLRRARPAHPPVVGRPRLLHAHRTNSPRRSASSSKPAASASSKARFAGSSSKTTA